MVRLLYFYQKVNTIFKYKFFLFFTLVFAIKLVFGINNDTINKVDPESGRKTGYWIITGDMKPKEGYDAKNKIEEGVYYNKYMAGNKIRMSKPLNDGSVEYSDGTQATVSQMSKDVTAFLTWAAEPHLEKRKRIGFKTIIYLLIFSVLVFLSMKKIWSRVETKM